ncbi:MAG: RES family NAD+ phosphorylase [Pseudomonadota bacterium]
MSNTSPDDSSLADLDAFEDAATAYRFANMRDALDLLERRVGIDLGSMDAGEVLNILGRDATPSEVTDLLDGPFKRKARLGGIYGPKTRFSDGSWPVFYGALELETARDEVQHHHARDVLTDPSHPWTAYYRYFRCAFTGSTKDLRSKLAEWPELVCEDWTFCQKLGREAHGSDLDGLFSPSARTTDGTNLPVFKRAALSNPEILGRAAFSVNPGSRDVSVILK